MKKFIAALILTACVSMLHADYYYQSKCPQGRCSSGYSGCSTCNQCPCQWTQGAHQDQCPAPGQQQQNGQRQNQQKQNQGQKFTYPGNNTQPQRYNYEGYNSYSH